jgi:uncharacterized delta-60 repeat protein
MLDPTFGAGGLVTTRFPSYEFLTSTAVDSLGRIVVAGSMSNGANYDFAVARYSPAGKLDPSFGGTGVVTISFGYNDRSFGVAVDSLDRVVVAGTVDDSSHAPSFHGFGVARLTAAGALDNSFDGDGKRTIDFGGTYEDGDRTGVVAVDSLDRVVVAGGTRSDNNDFAVARLTASGALDNSFDGDGKQTIDFGGSETAYGVAVDSLDRVVVAGETQSASYRHFAVARLTAGGALDSSFDSDGKQTVDFGGSYENERGVAVDSLDRVVVVGYAFIGSSDDFAVARLTISGALDSSFDSDGMTTIDFGTSVDRANGVAVDSLDRVVVPGYTYTPSSASSADFAVARLTGDTTTAAAQINDGSPQRSRVTSLTIRFSSQVTFRGAAADAFTLVRTGGDAVNFVGNVTVVNGGTVVTLNGFSGPETEFGSLRDGRYTLTALASQISAGGQALDGDADGTLGGDFTLDLHRLFGDVNGDRTVNLTDLTAFRNAFGATTTDANFQPFLDLNGDGVINGTDLIQFRNRFGVILP